MALVGPSGAGKTTMVRLAMRMIDPQEGRVTIDGVDLRDLKMAALRGAVALVPQDVALFNDSLHANIGFSRPDATSAEVRPRIEKSRELLAESERLLGELEAANPGESTFRKAADRLLAKIFPPPASGVADGVGGDAAGGTECACPPR